MSALGRAPRSCVTVKRSAAVLTARVVMSCQVRGRQATTTSARRVCPRSSMSPSAT